MCRIGRTVRVTCNPINPSFYRRANRFELVSSSFYDRLTTVSFICYPCMAFENEVYGAVVQTVRMPACQAGGRGFESLLRRQTVAGFKTGDCLSPDSSVGRATD